MAIQHEFLNFQTLESLTDTDLNTQYQFLYDSRNQAFVSANNDTEGTFISADSINVASNGTSVELTNARIILPDIDISTLIPESFGTIKGEIFVIPSLTWSVTAGSATQFSVTFNQVNNNGLVEKITSDGLQTYYDRASSLPYPLIEYDGGNGSITVPLFTITTQSDNSYSISSVNAARADFIEFGDYVLQRDAKGTFDQIKQSATDSYQGSVEYVDGTESQDPSEQNKAMNPWGVQNFLEQFGYVLSSRGLLSNYSGNIDTDDMESGIYRLNFSNDTSGTNPTSGGNAQMFVIREANDFVRQIIYDSNSSAAYTRSQSGGSFTNWTKFILGNDTGNSSGDIPINNGTVNNNLNADQVDGYHAGNSSGNVPVSDGNLNNNLNADLLDGKEGAHYEGWTKIASTTVSSNVASVDLDNQIDDTYIVYRLVGYGLDVDTSARLGIRVGNGSPGYITTNDYDTQEEGHSLKTNTFFFLEGDVDPASNLTINFNFDLFATRDSKYKYAVFHCACDDNSTGKLDNNIGTAKLKQTSNLTSIQFLTTSGNITAGTLALYGIRK